MTAATDLIFAEPELHARLVQLDAAQLDTLDFGVIGFGPDTRVGLYNRFESSAAGLPVAAVMGRPVFTDVAPCMNNFMVAQRFDDAHGAGVPLDAIIDYVLTLRMRPVKVKLRLLAEPHSDMRFILVERKL